VRFLNNLKIVTKVGLIVALLGFVIVGCLGLSILRMTEMAGTFTNLVSKEDAGTLALSRAGRKAESYRAAAFAILTETTDAGNAQQLGQTRASKAELIRFMDQAKVFDAKAASLGTIRSAFDTAFEICDPIIVAGSKASSVEENAKVAVRLQQECSPKLDAGIKDMSEFLDATVVEVQDKAVAANDSAHSTIGLVLTIAGVGTLAGIAVALFIGIAGLARPLAALKQVMERLARNDLSVEVTNKDRRDEVGDMARTLDVFKQGAVEIERMKKEQAESERLAAEVRRADVTKLADSFEGAVGEIIDTVSSASTELEASANVLADAAHRTQEVTSIVASASEEASTNVQSVASATEELASSVTEISRQVQLSSQIANDAVQQAQVANQRVGELSECASRIGAVVDLISTIARQTNLLALNATIEAARAGDAGRGFAVVAAEVKGLADQTAKATGEIGQQVDAIRTATSESVTTIQGIASTIGKMSEISATIASAVEEQGAATQEISRNVQQAAAGTKNVSSNITDVQKGAAETGSASSQVLSSAQTLAHDSASLKLQVSRFLETVRAA
jgi:methyl-accepting chemotaxis protein